MRIAFLSVFYPYRGGIAQFNAALYRALEKKHEVKAFTFTRQYPGLLFPGKTQYVSKSDKADQIPAERVLDSINPLSYISATNKIKDYKPDLLLIQNWMPFFGPSLGHVANRIRRSGIPVISLMANVKPHEPNFLDNILSDIFLKQNDGFVLLAEAVKNDLLDLQPNAKYLIHPHPNYEHFGKAIEKSVARKTLNIPSGKKVILFFGLIRKYKGLDILIKAMKNLGDDYYLLVAGECYGKFDEYQNLIDENLEKDNFGLHLRYLDDDEVFTYFSAADVCVLPYRTATQSGIVGISYNFGVPVISTDVGGLREVIEPFGAGVVVDRPEEKLLREAILEYFGGGKIDEYRNNVNKFSERYTWDSLADGIIEFAIKIKANKRI